MSAPNEILPQQLLRVIGTPDAPQIVDISIDPDFADDPHLIPGSFRHPHTDIPALLDRLAGRDCVVVCQRGLKLSQGLAAWLRSEGIGARYLGGGMFAWRDQSNAPHIPVGQIPSPIMGSTLWVTDDTPTVDHMACAWLIRRFVDHNARFLFVSADAVRGVADRFGATPFDVDGTFGSRRGPLCTFDTMLDEFALRTNALDRLAGVVRAADTNAHDRAPQAAGLAAISAGLWCQYADDVARLEAAMGLYDALYRWARDHHEEDNDRTGGYGA